MRKITYSVLLFTFSIAAFICFSTLNNSATSSSNGAPAGHTGSPGDTKNCKQCHGGNPMNMAGLITSNIPGTGYIPGTTYTIVAFVGGNGKSKFGFQVSPQKTTGTGVGTMTVTNPLETQKVSGVSAVEYMTHTSGGTGGTNGRSWTFNWTAPASGGSGPFTFYGAFNVTNNDGTASGDLIFLSTLNVTESTIGVNENTAINNLQIYPNPAASSLNIEISENINEFEYAVFDISGKIILNEKAFGNRHLVSVKDLAKGYYLVKISYNDHVLVKPFIKN